jgi:hypothetical protein
MRIKPLRIGEFLFYLNFSKGIAIPIGIRSTTLGTLGYYFQFYTVNISVDVPFTRDTSGQFTSGLL